MAESIQVGIRETFNVRTVITVLIAWVGYAACRLVHQYLLGRIGVLKNIPEVSDLVVMVFGAGFIRGANGVAFVTGAGLSLLNNLAKRLKLTWMTL